MIEDSDLLDAHLNVAWLRPESALWDAIASDVIAQESFESPSLDLGCGNGIFSFITAGGRFSIHYDWYRNAIPEGFRENRDIYDHFHEGPSDGCVTRVPGYTLDCGLDAKPNLLRQAMALPFYQTGVAANANFSWPFSDETFRTVFSNILYWLDSSDHVFRETRRVLAPRGRAYFCLQDPRFKEICVSYQWKKHGSDLLRLLNRGRSESSLWTVTREEIDLLCRKHGFTIVSHRTYLSPMTLRIWDVGLRPLSSVLLRMISRLSEEDRATIKQEWMDTLRPFLREALLLDRNSEETGGYHFVVLEKT